MAAAASSSSADLATLGRRLPLDGVKRNDCYGHGSGEGCRSRGCAPSSVPGAEGQEGPVSEGGGGGHRPLRYAPLKLERC
ncbi:hypothetical protein OPV22_019374 [Ensete ventricosum]|uniref:Uncharacterized protein n=1 Tax=Ensete ventricosum TaxID=4639 RepID=A0AAV8QBT1_ENSVE|nr:hypothetical protein OPV22_019374 [Ensete ventricosum]